MSIKKLKMSQYLHDIYFKLKLQPSTPINLYHFLPTFTNFLSLYYFFSIKKVSLSSNFTIYWDSMLISWGNMLICKIVGYFWISLTESYGLILRYIWLKMQRLWCSLLTKVFHGCDKRLHFTLPFY